MADFLSDKFNKLMTTKKNNKKRNLFVIILAVIVAAGTVAGVHYNGVAMSHKDKVLTCSVAESGTPVAHTHNSDCYDADGNLVCTLPEAEAHTHTEDCYDEEGNLICGMQELPVHVHSDACFTTVIVEEEPEQVAEVSEQTPEETAATAEVSTIPAAAEEAITAGVSNPAADVEDSGSWAAMFAGMVLTEDWDVDFLNIALSQRNYTESGANYVFAANGEKAGYSRYGAWAGHPYDKWDAAFVSFCLNYAKIPTDKMPRAAETVEYLKALTEKQLVRSKDEYVPMPGDLVFFDMNQDTVADRVVIVSAISPVDDVLQIVGGDIENTVREEQYSFSDARILCYAQLPKNPAKVSLLAENDTADLTFQAEADGMTVSVYAPEGAFPEGTTMVVTPIYDQGILDTAAGLVTDTVKSVQAVDITFYDAEGNAIEPAAPIKVTMTSAAIAEADDAVVVHVDNEGAVNVVDGETGSDTVAFESDAFSVYVIVGTELVTEFLLPGSDDTYEVTVTYGEDAQIPENVHLELAAYAEDSPEYATAKESVVTAKKAEDEEFDEYSLGFAALDISIVDNETGEKVEPADGAAVKVSIKVKNLPENVSEEDLADTLEIQHLNESTGTTVVETVAEVQDVTVADGTVKAEFTITSFSTFTITWSNAANNSTELRLRRNNNTRGQAAFYYVNTNGYAIARPTDINNNTDISISTNWPDGYDVVISSDNVARSISGRTYQRAYIVVNGTEQEVTRLSFTRIDNNEWQIDYYNGASFVTTASGSNVGGTWRLPVYLQYSGGADTDEATLHLVDANGNPLSGFTYNGETLGDASTFSLEEVFPASGNTLDLTTAFTKEGYTFSNSFINFRNGDSGGNVIGNMLRRDNNNLQYKTTPAGNSYSNVTNDTDIYLVFDPVPSGSSGGGSGGGGGETPDLGEIGNSKNVSSKDDGTYKVALSVSGSAQHKTEETDINVVFVIDCSNSMTMWGRTRLADTKVAVKNMANQLLLNNTTSNPDAIELSLVAFNATAWNVPLGSESNYWTTNYTTFANAVGTGNSSGITSSGGTNWEEALQKAISADKGDGNPTYVIFFTDGDPTEYAGHNTSADSNYENNYWPARDEARAIVNSGKVLYGIYAYGDTTGTHYLEPLVSYAYNGSSSGYYYNASDTTAVQQALEDILDTINMNFAYADVEIDDGITGLSTMTFESLDPESFEYTITYKDYTSTTAYETKTVNITVSGTTNNQTIAIPAVTYHVLDKDSNNNPIVKEKTTTAVTIKGATYSTTDGKSVTWDMEKTTGTGNDAIYMLEDGWTYEVSFTVWPSQASYDLIAALNNQIIAWGEDFTYTDDSGAEVTIPFATYESQVNQGTPYSLKTNTSAGVKYRQVKATTDSEGHTTYEYGDEKTVPIVTAYEMDLESQLMPVVKQFDDDINTHNPYTKVRFYLMMDGKYYMNDGSLSDTLVPYTGSETEYTIYMDLDQSNNWSDDIYIAPGVMTVHDGTQKILEHGHSYSLVEKNITGDEYEYEFTPQTVRPMEINGQLTYLVKVDQYNPATGTTYTIDGDTYFVAPANAQALIGTNRKTGEIDITKVISDPDNLIPDAEENSETFTYAVTLNIPAGKDARGIMGYEFVPRYSDAYNGSSRIYIYGYQGEVDSSGNLNSTPFTPDSTKFVNLVYGRYNSQVYRLFADMDDSVARTVTVYMTLAQNEVIRFTNLPAGTTYSITEVAANVGNANDGNNYPTPITSFTVPEGGTPADQGYTVTSKSSAGGTGGATITGEITTLDTRYYHQFTNTVTEYTGRVYAELKVKKVVEDYDWLNEYYRFTLAAGTATYSDGSTGTSPMPSTTQVSIYNSTADHTLSFGSIRYEQAGTYEYTLTEGTYYNYVDYADPVTITVTVEEQNGDLVVTNIEDSAGTTVYTAATSTAQANGLTTQTNKIKTIDVTATKEWLKADGETVLTTLPDGTTATFVLYKDGEATDQVTLDGEVDENGETAEWTATWTGLPQYTVTTITNEDGTQTRTATEIEYTIDEDPVPDGFEKVTAAPVESGGTIQNKQLARLVIIQKRKQDGEMPLAGAVFSLYTKEGYESTPKADPIQTNLTSSSEEGKEGLIDCGELPYGEYYLVETKAPDGYNLLSEAVTLTVNANGISILQGGSLRTDNDPDDTVYQAFITNDEGVELPNAGGIGTNGLMLLGIALAATASVLVVLKTMIERRREAVRLNTKRRNTRR
ncbi:MAG: VWA domain-containing protein [Eubacterium sp.]|nr:VWA domain-containing protein [Eubacterium sp.]